jgi:Bacterial capsule synthesis protein PGA_cap
MTVKQDTQIVICGDLCVTPDTAVLFESGNAQGLFKGLMEPFHQADLLIGNLEFPLTDLGQGITKCGPVLKGKTRCINALTAAGFDVLGLANNHIRDCGDEGVLSTLVSCRQAGILTVGTGENITVARKPLVVNVNGWTIGVKAFAEHEFNAAAENRAGANLFDPYESLDEIRALRKECDYLILLYHGGIEHYAYPSPILQKKCRKMVECGADLVLCQHSHCIGTAETHQRGTIVYGQGNSVFGYRPNSPDWNEGLIVKVSLSGISQPQATVEYLPIVADIAGIDLAPSDESGSILETFFERSKRIRDPEFINSSWRSFCKARQSHYLPQLLGLGRVLTFANRKLENGIVHLFYSRKRLRVIMNLIRCEAHHEIVQTVLQKIVERDE